MKKFLEVIFDLLKKNIYSMIRQKTEGSFLYISFIFFFGNSNFFSIEKNKSCYGKNEK